MSPKGLYALSAASGALLFLSHHPVHAWPLLPIALVPFFLGLHAARPGLGVGALAGAFAGACYAVPQLCFLKLPLVLGGGLGLVVVASWAVVGAIAGRALAWGPVRGAFGTAAAAAFVDWLQHSSVPAFGTSQSWVKVWSVAPPAAQIVSLAGMAGLVFVLVAAQAVVTQAIVHRSARLGCVAWLGALLGGVAGWSAWRWVQPAHTHVTVAAVGWTSADRPEEETHERLAREAAAKGAKLIVSPETGLEAQRGARAALFGRLSALARELRVTLAVGYWDEERTENRVALFSPDGTPDAAEYRKSHLIPFLERYSGGDGTLVVRPLDTGSREAQLGVMVCQDDNFTDLSRGYGRRGVDLVAVPTNDWAAVKDHHVETSRFRAIENGYGVVRATSNGVSEIVSPRGEVLARMDHVKTGPGAIVASLPLIGAGTPYSTFGDVWPVACAVLLVAGALDARRRRRRLGYRV